MKRYDRLDGRPGRVAQLERPPDSDGGGAGPSQPFRPRAQRFACLRRPVDTGIMRSAVVVALLSIAACSSSSSSNGSAACEPSLTELNSLVGTEVRAVGSDEVEGWALLFNSWELTPGEPLTIPKDKEVKVVWRLSGEGDLSFRAIGPKGDVENLVWGPELHGRSNWERPGEEWGTGWLLPTAGCWTLEVARGAAILSISAEVT